MKWDREIARLWEWLIESSFNKKIYLNRLIRLMEKNGINKNSLILDASGGHGFPYLDLLELGHNIAYNDASHSMKERMEHRRNKVPKNHKHKPTTYRWQELRQHPLAGKFKLAIIRGNSLIFASSWAQKNPNLDIAKEEIQESIVNIYDTLEPNGFFYVDIPRENEDKTEINIPNLICKFENNQKRKIRTFSLVEKCNDKEAYVSKGYLLSKDELKGMLKSAGFRDIKEINLEGDWYQGVIAKK